MPAPEMSRKGRKAGCQESRGVASVGVWLNGRRTVTIAYITTPAMVEPLLPPPQRPYPCMVPTPVNLRARSAGFLYPIASLVAHHVPKLVSRVVGGDDNVSHDPPNAHTFAKREEEKHDTKFIVFACLIPVLVLLSGLFAGLTLGYMSLDETQLHVLSVSGTP